MNRRRFLGTAGAFAAGAPSPLPDLPVQYADFVLWQRENLRGGEMESQLAFWRTAPRAQKGSSRAREDGSRTFTASEATSTFPP
jgi:hypothetical protein